MARKFNLDVEPDELPFVDGNVVDEESECTVCYGPLRLVGTAAGVEIHECIRCRQRHRALERCGDGSNEDWGSGIVEGLWNE